MAAAQYLACDGDPPNPPVLCKGELTGNDEARGMWVIEPREIPLADGMSLQMGKVSGSWVIKSGGE